MSSLELENNQLRNYETETSDGENSDLCAMPRAGNTTKIWDVN
jgi:hypothetical protein